MRHERPELFHGLHDDQVDKILAQGHGLSLHGGDHLFALGGDAGQIFLIRRGRIRLTLPMQVRGQEEEILVEDMGPGQTVGWSALIPPYRFTLRATASVDTELIALSREALRDLFAAEPALGYTVSQNVASIVGERLQLFQAMWLREMQRTVELHCH